MRIKEVARRTGLTEKTIRYYESRGLVLPDTEERNGKLWRNYTEEHVALLSAVATLRKSFFHVEEIDGILTDPARIPETLAEVRARVEETYETLGKLRAAMEQPQLSMAPDLLTLAAELREATKPLSLPPQDLKFNFRAMDRMLAEEKRSVEETPSAPLRFGWEEVYRGQDRQRFQELRRRLTLFGIENRAYSYLSGSQAAGQNTAAPAIPAWSGKSGCVDQIMQIKLAKNPGTDSYAIEVRRRDAAKAYKALRSDH